MVERVFRDFLTAEDREGVFNADHFPLWYKRAAEQVPGTFVYSIPFSSGMMLMYITHIQSFHVMQHTDLSCLMTLLRHAGKEQLMRIKICSNLANINFIIITYQCVILSIA